MLDIANYPPRSQQDVSLSETGRVILESALSKDQLRVVGQAACSELVDSYGEAGPPRIGNEVSLVAGYGFLLEAGEFLDHTDWEVLRDGFNQLRKDLSEVPA